MIERPHTVRFENLDREVQVPDNANLREVCLREEAKLYFGTATLRNCRGKARCGTCRVRVLEGADSLSPMCPPEQDRIGGESGGVRLACQANVRGPVTVDTRG